jgi:hypothetical protein
MSDLISRKVALEAIENIGDGMNLSNKECELYGRIYDSIAGQMSAYDVDKVVGRLKTMETSNNEKAQCKYTEGYGCAIDEAIEIVKGGGRDE